MAHTILNWNDCGFEVLKRFSIFDIYIERETWCYAKMNVLWKGNSTFSGNGFIKVLFSIYLFTRHTHAANMNENNVSKLYHINWWWRKRMFIRLYSWCNFFSFFFFFSLQENYFINSRIPRIFSEELLKMEKFIWIEFMENCNLIY